MRRSSILVNLSAIAKLPAPSSDKKAEGPTSADVELCRKYLKRHKGCVDFTRRCVLIIVAVDLGDKASIKGLARMLDTDHKYVKKWLKRFVDRGFEVLNDAPRSGRPNIYDNEKLVEGLNVLTNSVPS